MKILSRSFLTAVTMGTLMITSTNIAHAGEQLTPSTATYNFSIDGKKGTATRTLKQSGSTWQYDTNASVAGIANASQHATFNIKNNQVIPVNASTTYKVFGIGRTHKISFQGKQAISTYKGKSVTLSMPKQAYDDLTLEAQIRQELLNDKFSGSYQMVKKDSIEPLRFTKTASQKITVPVGTFDVVRVDRVHQDKNRQTSFWLAPSLNYLPVKVSQIKDGKEMNLELNKYQNN